MKLINRIKETWHMIFEDITIFEYVLIWIARLMLLYAVIFHKDPNEKLMCFINMLSLYAMSLIKFIAPRKSFLARLDFRCQHIIGFFEVLGTFFGNFLDAYSYINKYDRWLHVFSGIGAVIAGYYLFKAFDSAEGKKKFYSPSLGAFCGISFSFVIIACWEISEFLGDFFTGTKNQCYLYVPPENDIWFRLFGNIKEGCEGQFALWDTMMDMIDAAVTTFATGIALFIVLTLWKRHALKVQDKEKCMA